MWIILEISSTNFIQIWHSHCDLYSKSKIEPNASKWMIREDNWKNSSAETKIEGVSLEKLNFCDGRRGISTSNRRKQRGGGAGDYSWFKLKKERKFELENEVDCTVYARWNEQHLELANDHHDWLEAHYSSMVFWCLLECFLAKKEGPLNISVS